MAMFYGILLHHQNLILTKINFMKTLAINLTVVLFMLMNTIFANPVVSKVDTAEIKGVHASIVIRQEEKVIVYVNRNTDETILVTISDKKGHVCSERSITAGDNIVIAHDITNFDNGEYEVKVNNGDLVIAQSYFVKTKK
jgi:hypothetical protein